MDIIIIGGHGKVALLAEPLLVQQGHRVTAVIRDPGHAAEVEATGARALVEDAESLDAAGWDRLLTGADAVVWSAGAGGGNPERTRAVDRDAAIAAIDAAGRVGARRFVMVSYFGARPDHGIDPASSFHAYAEAKAAADAHLRESGLDWTILGPSGLTLEEGTGRVELVDLLDAEGGFAATDVASATVPRADVAAVIAETVGREDVVGRFLGFNAGEVPIAEALAR
ncbi:NAD(P)H-binding protein [Brachybacterium sp. DNPG3]